MAAWLHLRGGLLCRNRLLGCARNPDVRRLGPHRDMARCQCAGCISGAVSRGIRSRNRAARKIVARQGSFLRAGRVGHNRTRSGSPTDRLSLGAARLQPNGGAPGCSIRQRVRSPTACRPLWSPKRRAGLPRTGPLRVFSSLTGHPTRVDRAMRSRSSTRLSEHWRGVSRRAGAGR